MWRARARIPIFYGTTWLATTGDACEVGCEAVPALRGTILNNNGSCEATRYDPTTNAFGYMAKTQLRYYVPVLPAGQHKNNKPRR